MSHEDYDPELIREIEAYLTRERAKNNPGIEPEVAKKFITGHVRGIQKFQALFLQEAALQTSTEIVTYEQSVVEPSTELTSLTQGTIDLLQSTDESMEAKERGFSLNKSSHGVVMLSATLRGQTIPSFLNASYLMFEHYRPQQLDHIGYVGMALEMNVRFPFSRLSIGSPAGALTDAQTRAAMDNVVDEFPDTLAFGLPCDTDFYFFKGRGAQQLVGKVINRPKVLLGKRDLLKGQGSMYPAVALGEITPSDLILARIGLMAIQRATVPPSI